MRLRFMVAMAGLVVLAVFLSMVRFVPAGT